MLRLQAQDQANNWHILDTYESPQIELTLSAKDVQDITKRTSSWSKTVTLPGSKTNNNFFENLFNANLTATSFLPNRRVRVNVTEGGTEVLDGYLQLTGINILDQSEVQYEVALYGSFADLAKSLGEKLIVGNPSSSDDLTFPEIQNEIQYNFTWAKSTWDGDSDQFGVVYALADYGYGWTSNQISTATANGIRLNENLLPSIYVKRIWDKIFAEAGYRYQSTFLAGDLFKKLFLLNPNLDRGAEELPFLQAFKTAGSNNQVNYSGTTSTYITFNSEYLDTYNQWNASDTFTATGTELYNFDIYLNLYFDGGSQTKGGSVYLEVNGARVDFDQGASVNGNSGTYKQYHFTKSLYLQSGSTVKIRFAFSYGGPGAYIRTDTTLPNGNSINVTQKTRVDVQNLLPQNMKQVDFVSSIIKMFNLIVEPSVDDPRTLVIEPRNEWLAAGTRKDWSEKLDRSGDYQLTLLSEDAKRIYKFTHQSDVDYPNANYENEKGFVYGQASVEIDNDFLKEEQIVTTGFASTFVTNVSGYSALHIPKVFDYDGQTYKKVTTKPKILINNGEQPISGGPGKINVSGVDSTTFPLCTIYEDPYQPDAQSIVFGDSVNFWYNKQANTVGLYDTYWADEIDSISSPDARLLKCRMYLTPQDITDLRFNDQVFLIVEGNPSWWRPMKVSYRPGANELSVVELVKIDNLATKPVVQKRKTFLDINPDDGNIGDPIGPGDVLPGPRLLLPGRFIDGPNLIPSDALGTNLLPVAGFNEIFGWGNIISVGGELVKINGSYNTVLTDAMQISITGSQNTVGEGSVNVSITGTGNTVGNNCENVTVTGSGNTVPDGTSNVTITGDSQTATASDKLFAVIDGASSTLAGTDTLNGTPEAVVSVPGVTTSSIVQLSWAEAPHGILYIYDIETGGFTVRSTDIGDAGKVFNWTVVL